MYYNELHEAPLAFPNQLGEFYTCPVPRNAKGPKLREDRSLFFFVLLFFLLFFEKMDGFPPGPWRSSDAHGTAQRNNVDPNKWSLAPRLEFLDRTLIGKPILVAQQSFVFCCPGSMQTGSLSPGSWHVAESNVSPGLLRVPQNAAPCMMELAQVWVAVLWRFV